MNRRVNALLLLLLLLVLLTVSLTSIEGAAQGPQQVTVFYNSACRDCVDYIEEKLLPLLAEFGLHDIVQKDFINDRANRAELNQRSSDMGIPIPLQAHLATFIGDRIVLEGHVPAAHVRELFSIPDPPLDRILIYQDKMPEMGQEATSYKIWAFRGPVKEYPIETPISEYLGWFAANRDQLPAVEGATEGTWGLRELLPLVLWTGLLDGVNPCAFAVLLFFIAFMFTLQRARAEMLLMGASISP